MSAARDRLLDAIAENVEVEYAVRAAMLDAVLMCPDEMHIVLCESEGVEESDVDAVEVEWREMETLLGRATRFTYGDDFHTQITAEHRGPGDRWAVLRSGQVWCREDQAWEWEPQPSSRDVAFKERTRYPRDEAVMIALSHHYALPQ